MKVKTMAVLAKKVGVTNSAVSYWLKGRYNATPNKAKKLTKILTGGNKINDVIVWTGLGSVEQRTAMFNAWASNNK